MFLLDIFMVVWLTHFLNNSYSFMFKSPINFAVHLFRIGNESVSVPKSCNIFNTKTQLTRIKLITLKTPVEIAYVTKPKLDHRFGRFDLYVIKSGWKPFPLSNKSNALVRHLSSLFTTSVCPFVVDAADRKRKYKNCNKKKCLQFKCLPTASTQTRISKRLT